MAIEESYTSVVIRLCGQAVVKVWDGVKFVTRSLYRCLAHILTDEEMRTKFIDLLTKVWESGVSSLSLEDVINIADIVVNLVNLEESNSCLICFVVSMPLEQVEEILKSLPNTGVNYDELSKGINEILSPTSLVKKIDLEAIEFVSIASSFESAELITEEESGQTSSEAKTSPPITQKDKVEALIFDDYTYQKLKKAKQIVMIQKFIYNDEEGNYKETASNVYNDHVLRKELESVGLTNYYETLRENGILRKADLYNLSDEDVKSLIKEIGFRNRLIQHLKSVRDSIQTVNDFFDQEDAKRSNSFASFKNNLQKRRSEDWGHFHHHTENCYNKTTTIHAEAGSTLHVEPSSGGIGMHRRDPDIRHEIRSGFRDLTTALLERREAIQPTSVVGSKVVKTPMATDETET